MNAIERFRTLDAQALGIPDFKRLLGARVYPPSKRTVRVSLVEFANHSGFDFDAKNVVRSFSVSFPYCLFVLSRDSNNDTGLFAFLSTHDISDPVAPVFPVVLPNVGLTGEVCLGCRCPEDVNEAVGLFWGTSFTGYEIWEGLSTIQNYLFNRAADDPKLMFASNTVYKTFSRWQDHPNIGSVFTTIAVRQAKPLYWWMNHAVCAEGYMFPRFNRPT